MRISFPHLVLLLRCACAAAADCFWRSLAGCVQLTTISASSSFCSVVLRIIQDARGGWMEKNGVVGGAWKGDARQDTKRDNSSFARWAARGKPCFLRPCPSPFRSFTYLLSSTFKGREVRQCYFTARALASVYVCVSAYTHYCIDVGCVLPCMLFYVPCKVRETNMKKTRIKKTVIEKRREI